MRIPISNIEKAKIQISFQKAVKNANIFFFVALAVFITAIALFDTVLSDYTKPENSSSIEAPVAFIYTDDGSGTAFLTSPTKLVTARHVVENVNIGDEVGVIFKKVNPEIKCSAKLIWKDNSEPFDPSMDFAILEIINPQVIPTDMPTLVLGSSEDVEVETPIKIIGYPKTLFSITAGQISNTTMESVDSELDLFQLNCDMYPGNSGGPVLDSETEEVIGVAVSGMTGDFQGINFACKIDNLLDILEEDGISIYDESELE